MAERDGIAERDEWGEGRFEDEWLNAGFVTFPVVLLFDQEVSGGAKATFGALCWHIWRNGKVPPQTVLAEELGGGVRTIKRHLAELEGAGYIARVQYGLGRPNDYIIKGPRFSGAKNGTSRGPKMAGQGGQKRPSLERQDVETKTQQQQGPSADPRTANGCCCCS